MAKTQVPVLGGLRKVINTGGSSGSGTTISEYGATTVSLAQIKKDMGVTSGGNTVVVGPSSPTNISIIVDAKDGADSAAFNVTAAAVGAASVPIVAVWQTLSDTTALTTEASVLPAINAATANLIYAYSTVSGVIQRVRILTAGGVGSCSVDIWKAAFGSFPPVIGGSIVASSPPAISSGVTYSDAVLLGWTKNVLVGDVLAFKLNSSSTFTQIMVVLEVLPG